MNSCVKQVDRIKRNKMQIRHTAFNVCAFDPQRFSHNTPAKQTKENVEEKEREKVEQTSNSLRFGLDIQL